MSKVERSKDVYTINDVIGLVVRGDTRQLREVLFHQPELAEEKEDSNFNTPLHVASSRGFIPIVHMLVARKWVL